VEITDAQQVFSASGLPEKMIRNVKWVNVTAQGETAGAIEYARDWAMTNVKLQARDGLPVRASNNTNVDTLCRKAVTRDLSYLVESRADRPDKVAGSRLRVFGPNIPETSAFETWGKEPKTWLLQLLSQSSNQSKVVRMS
jgi:hypothetical protein